ncbi:MAG: hypothetical protein GY849_21170 [Deltaproteobacteria bacterium]|nr:hypothetical protein [Deltaproteobacteria bacterium]
MMTKTKWKARGLEVQIPDARFLEEFEKMMRSKFGDSGDADSVISGLFCVHVNIEGWPSRANRKNYGDAPFKASYAISMDEADELANWLIERFQDIRKQSSTGGNNGKGQTGKNRT